MRTCRRFLWRCLLFYLTIILPHLIFYLSFSIPDCFPISPRLFPGFWGPKRPARALISTLDTFGCLLSSDISIASLSHFTASTMVLRREHFFFSTFWCIFGLDENRIIPSRILPMPAPIALSVLVSTLFWTTDFLVASALFYNCDSKPPSIN